jgi:hypothetical protein
MVRGSYDAQGQFIGDNGNRYGSNNGYGNGNRDGYSNDRYQNDRYQNDRYQGDRPNDSRHNIPARITNIGALIERDARAGHLNRDEARRANAELESIRRYDRSLRNRNGTLSSRNDALVMARLERLTQNLRAARANG